MAAAVHADLAEQQRCEEPHVVDCEKQPAAPRQVRSAGELFDPVFRLFKPVSTHVEAAHQNLSVSCGPIGKCDKFSPMLLVNRPKSELPPNAGTPIVEGTVHLRQRPPLLCQCLGAGLLRQGVIGRDSVLLKTQ